MAAGDAHESSEDLGGGTVALFVQARGGDRHALDALRRRHRAALRTVAAGYLHDGSDPDVIVEQALGSLRKVGTPESDGGAVLTLFALVRQAAEARAQTAGDVPHGLVDLSVRGDHPELSPTRRQQLLDAFASLDGREQAVLWFTAVEGSDPTDLAGRLPIGSVDTAASTSHKTRAHLRTAFAKATVADPDLAESCRGFVVHLAALADGNISASREATLRAHLEECPHCRDTAAELGAVSGLLLGLAAPIVRDSSLQSASSLEALVDFDDERPATSRTGLAVGADLFTGDDRETPVAAPPLAAAPGPDRRRAAPLILAGVAVVVVAALVWWGLTAGSDGGGGDELAVVVATTTTASTGVDDGGTARPATGPGGPSTTGATSGTPKTGTTGKKTTKKGTTGKKTTRPGRTSESTGGSTSGGTGSGGSTSSGTGGSKPGGSGSTVPTTPGSSAPATTSAPTTTTTLAVDVVLPPGSSNTFEVEVRMAAAKNVAGRSMLLSVDTPAGFAGTATGCTLVDGDPTRLLCGIDPGTLVADGSAKVWSHPAITVTGASGLPTITAELVTTP